MNTLEIGIDIGGTFTDAVLRDDTGTLRFLKVSSTPDDPARALAHAVDALLDGADASHVIRFLHGTTVATNAVLENTTARVGLITTAGFADVLELGRMSRASNYDLHFGPQTPVDLLPQARRLEARERIDAGGRVVQPLDEADVTAAARHLSAMGVEAVAVCFLFAYLNDAHERRAAEIICAACPKLAVSLSCEVDPMPREYERTCATAVDAALKPVMAAYLQRVEAILAARGITAPLQVMQSRGGLMSAAAARERPIRLLLSGPAAAAIGAASALRAAGFADGISVDVGGTSADVALIANGAPALRATGQVGAVTIRVPTLDAVAVAAGGGSLAWIDALGVPRVGPRSAGADPGPACYGRGGVQPTVLDAAVVLGFIDPVRFANGGLRLDAAAAAAAVWTRIAGPLDLDLQTAAAAIYRVATAIMAEAVRCMTISRGTDPRGLPLVPAGGGGGLHAAAIAEELGLVTIVLPVAPGVLAALGLLDAPVERDAARGFFHPIDGLAAETLSSALADLIATCAAALRADGISPDAVETEVLAAASFVGQGHALQVRIPADAPDLVAAIKAAFLEAHRHAYGHAPDAAIRLVELRVVQRSGASRRTGLSVFAGATARTQRPVWFGQGMVDTPIVPRAALAIGEILDGPAVLEQADTTVLVPPGWRLVPHPQHLLMTRIGA